MKTVYLAMAVLGAIVPYAFFVTHIRAHGLGLDLLLQEMFANSMAGGLTSDLFMSSFVFWIWMARSKARGIWIFILLNLCIGLSCAFPAYLYAREREADLSARIDAALGH